MKHIQTFESINEASKFAFTEVEVKKAAEALAKAMAKLDKVKVTVHDFEYDKGRGAGFELSHDGNKYDGGSYYIKPNGDVVNAAIGGGTKYGTIKSSEKDFIKGIKSNGFHESVVTEGSAGSMELLTTGKYKDVKGKTHTLKKGQIGKHERVGWDGDFIHFGSLVFSADVFGEEDLEVYESAVTEGRGDQFLIIKDGKEVKGFKTWSGAKKYVEANKGYSADDIQSSEWYHDHKNESELNEGGMSDMYLTATEAKDESEFIKDFFKENGDKVKKTPASVKWAKSIYADAIEMTLESVSVLTESSISDMYALAGDAKDEAGFIKDFFKEYGSKIKKNPASIKWAKEIYAEAMEMALESAIHEGTLIDIRLVKENVEDDIEAAITTWLNTVADGNAVAVSDLYLESGVLIGTLAEDIKQGREQIQGYFERFLSSSPIGSVDSFILQSYGDICISDGNYTFEMDGTGGNRESVSARYTFVWKKENKKWMIATHHSSAEPKNN
jgi:uncharacterized protein (TIGR02246 family)